MEMEVGGVVGKNWFVVREEVEDVLAMVIWARGCCRL